MTIPIWNEDTRELIAPVRNSDTSLAEKIKTIGLEITKEIELPIKFPYKFYLCFVPKDFIVEVENDKCAESYSFSKNNQPRFRVSINDFFPYLMIYNRFFIDYDFIDSENDIIYCVRDSLKMDEFDDEEGIIYKPTGDMKNQEEECKHWLELHYPNYENPNEYWDIEL